MAKNEIAVIEKKVHPLVTRAEKYVIKTDDDMGEAVKMLSEMNRFGDHIEGEKNKVLKPLNQAIKAERARWKPIETMFETGISALRATMSKYQTARTLAAAKEADKIASRVGDGKGKLKAETAMQKIDEIDKPATSVSTEAGSVNFRTVKKFEVMDITLLPKEFILPNEPAIRAAMKDGKELPGVRYFETQEPVNFR